MIIIIYRTSAQTQIYNQRVCQDIESARVAWKTLYNTGNVMVTPLP
jgi:hypothetical protein